MTAVTFRIKPVAPVEIELDINALTFEDALQLFTLQSANDEQSIRALMPLLSKVAGQDVSKLPISYVQPMTAAIMQAIQGDGDEAKN